MNRFEQTVAVAMGSDVHVHGSVYQGSAMRPATAQVGIDTGAANVTFYPTPEALEVMAAYLQELAIVVRDMRGQVAA